MAHLSLALLFLSPFSLGKKHDVPPVEVEKAIHLGLSWLAAHQKKDGSWPWKHEGTCDCENLGSLQDVGGAALAVLPFIEAARKTRIGSIYPYRENIDRSLAHLVSKQQADGRFADLGVQLSAYATWALCEGFALTRDERLKSPCQKAVNFLVEAQHREGGWRYSVKQAGDLEVSSYVVLALESARRAGFKVPKRTLKRATHFLDSVSNEDGSLYGFVAPFNPNSPSKDMTIVGLLCRLRLGWDPNRQAFMSGIDFITEKFPGGANAYYWQMGTQLLRGVESEKWALWRQQMQQALLAIQDRGKPLASPHQVGSWRAESGRTFIGGRVQTTASSVLALLHSHDVATCPDCDREVAWEMLKDGRSCFETYRAVEWMVRHPERGVRLLNEKLAPVEPVPCELLDGLIKQLGAADFVVREKAAREIERLGDAVVPTLGKALTATPVLEIRQRPQVLLNHIEETKRLEYVRFDRSLQVLSVIGNDPARALVERLARGAEGAWLTNAACEALKGWRNN